MSDLKKTKAQLIEELRQLRPRVSVDESSASNPYQAIFESTTEGILIADTATRCFVDANPAICRMLGYTREQLAGMSVDDIHPPESIGQALEDFTAMVRGEKTEASELRCLKGDGSVFYADVRVGRAVMHGRPCAVGFFSDVTERCRAYDLARLQCTLAIDLNSADNLNAALRQCLDAAIASSGMDSGGVYLVDPVTGGLELQCHTGLSYRFVSACAHFDADAPNTRLVKSGTPAYVIHSALPQHMTVDQHSEGLRALAVIPVLHAGQVIACLNIASHTVDDIAPDARRTLEAIAAAVGGTVSRLKTEQTLAVAETRYQEVFGTIQEGIGIVDDNEIILLANPAYARIFDEESVDAIIGRSLLEFLPDDQREIVLQQTAHRRNNERSRYELEIVTKKGNRKSLLVSVTPRFSDDGRYTGAVGAVLDITERKRHEDNLRLLSHRLSLATESAGIGVWDLNLKTNHLVWDERMYEMYGVSENDFGGAYETWQRCVHPEDLERASREVNEAVVGSRDFHTSFRVVVLDGQVRHIEAHAIVLQAADGTPERMVGVNLDITDRKKAEERLRTSEAFDRAVIDNSPIGISIRDAKARLLSVNKAWIKIWGVSQRDVDHYIKESATVFIGAANREQLGQWLPQVESIYRQGGTLHIPELYYSQDPPARPRWVSFTYYSLMNDRGEVDRVVILTEDITERKQAEDALRESESRFRELADLLPQTVYELDTAGRFTYSNEFGFVSTGYTLADIDAGLNALELVTTNDRERCAEAMQQVLGGERRGADEYTMRRKDGTEFTAIIYSSPILSEGQVVGIRGIVADITERKRAEKELKQLSVRHETLLASVPDIIMEVDGNKVYTWANVAGYHFFGDDVIGKEAASYFEGVQDTYDAVKPLFAGHDDIIYVESWQRRRDGEKRLLAWWCKVRKDAEGRVVGALSTARDITEHKLAAAELRRSQEFSESIVNSLPDIFYVFDTQGKFLRVNERFTTVVDYPLEEVMNMHPLDFFAADEKKRVEDAIKEVFEKGESFVEADFLSKDGKRTPYYFTGYRAVIDNVPLLVGLGIDITVRKQAQEALLAAEEKYRTLVNNVPVSVYRSTPEGRVLSANPASVRMMGYDSEEEFCARQAQDSYVDKKCRERFLDELRKHGSVGGFESQMIRKDGKIVWISTNATIHKSDHGDVEYIDGTEEDITERKRVEEALQIAEEKYRTLLNNVPVSVFRSTPDGRVLSANPALIRILGYDSEEDYCSRLAWDSYVDPHRRQEFLDELDKYGFVANFESQMIRKDGKVVWVSANATAHKNEKGEIEYIDGTEEDITELKLAREALAESEERYRQIVEASPFGMHMYQLKENGRLVFEGANPAADWILRIDHTRLKGKTIEEAFPNLVGTEVPEQYRKIARHGERWRTENIAYEDGVIKGAFEVVAFQRSPMKMAAVFKDITERKQAEEALRVAEEQYRLLFEGAEEGIVVAQNGMIVLSNPAWTVLSGFQADELSQLLVTELIHPEDREFVIDRYRRRISGEDVPTGYDFRMVTKKGDIRTMRVNSSLLMWKGRPATLNFLIDVTARRQAEEDILKFKTISDNATYGTQILGPDATFLYVNQAFAEMHGYTPEELIGRPVSLCHTEEQMTTVSAGIKDVFRSGSFASLEIWHVRRDGTEFPALMSGTVINDASGQMQYMACTTVDITDLKRLQELADRGHRLEAAGRIAGEVAHDFNNLLGPLVAYPGIIREELGEGHPVNVYLEPIEIAAQQMAEINQQLLTLGRRGHYTLEPLNLNEIIRHTLKRVESEHSTLKVVTDLAANLMNISGGVAQLSRVITNLVTNAVDAMKGSGTLTITSENWYADEPQGTYGQIARGEYVKLTITDTGCGIPRDVMPRVFEPFFTTKKTDRKRGSGLGLSVVHAVVEDHRGYVDIDSVVDEGTSVSLYLPTTRDEVIVENDTTVSGGSESVMVVDDDAVQREVTLRLLQKLGYRVETVSCGEMALERLQSESFDLLILDMVMPGGLDGADTCLRAKELHPGQKAIIVSGFAESDRVSEAQQMGAGAFVKKPLTLKSLATAVRRELDREQVMETVG